LPLLTLPSQCASFYNETMSYTTHHTSKSSFDEERATKVLRLILGLSMGVMLAVSLHSDDATSTDAAFEDTLLRMAARQQVTLGHKNVITPLKAEDAVVPLVRAAQKSGSSENANTAQVWRDDMLESEIDMLISVTDIASPKTGHKHQSGQFSPKVAAQATYTKAAPSTPKSDGLCSNDN